MHINDFEGLEGSELSDKQQEVFTAFFKDDSVDIGLGTLRVTHVKGAIYLAEQYANVKGLKKWHPQFERIMHMMLPVDDVLGKAQVLQIAALSWYAWGVLTEQVAFYGEHLITLALFLFGYGCVRSCLREDDTDDDTPFEVAIHSLPYMRDWFTTSLPRDNDPMYSLYLSWVNQLKLEKESLTQLATGSNASDKEASSLLHARTERLRKAERQEEDWLVEWLRTSIYHLPQPPYNIFQATFLQNRPLCDDVCHATQPRRSPVVTRSKKQRLVS